MSSWTSLGHAVRRRMGAPTNHHEAAGKGMSKDLTPEQVIASGARAYMGSAAGGFTSPSATPVAGTLIGKKSTQAADATIADKANRQNIERAGAQYRITAKMPAPINIEAAATMANARIVPSVAGKQTPNFFNGVDSTY